MKLSVLKKKQIKKMIKQDSMQNRTGHDDECNGRKDRYKNVEYEINGQVASINRDWQKQVWRAHNDKQKRIEMLRRNGGNKKIMTDVNKSVSFVPHNQGYSQQNGSSSKKRGNGRNKKNKVKNGKQMNQNRWNNGKKKNNATKGNNNSNDNNDNNAGSIKFEWMPKLMEMGFSYENVAKALSATNSIGYNEALDYLMQNS